MAARKLTEGQVEEIRASASKPAAELARKFGISERQVRNYRKQGREVRQELAREIIAEHVAEHVPDALADLTKLRSLARTKYEISEDPRDGALWLRTIQVTLDKVTPDDTALDDEIDRELRRLAPLADGGETPAP